ncbi:MAG: PUA domain-containing protein [Candidatus Bathyarchaeia archaeon]
MKNDEALLRIRKTADYQFGSGVGDVLFPDDVEIHFSKQTGRIRHVFLDGALLATLRPNDGMFSLTLKGANRIAANVKPLCQWVKVQKEVAEFVRMGKNVFAKHVFDVDDEIRPKEEVIVLDEEDKVIAIGRAALSGEEMRSFKHGIAVRVRRGVSQEAEKV